MERFHIIEEGACILASKGRYRQAKVFHRGGDVYAQVGATFVKLGAGGGTSDPHLSWHGVEADGVELNKFKRPIYAAELEQAAA